MSAREYLALPEEKPYLEYIDGVVEQKPMVNAQHGRTVARLDHRFILYAEKFGGDYGPERRIGPTTVGNYLLPDTGFWLAGTPSGDDTVPTIAVEVRSPRQSLTKLRAKCRGYLRDGSIAAWLIDPQARTVEVFEADVTRVLRENETLSCDALPGFAVELSWLFSQP
jgi:Uma2 family endonuclease